ncbi:MAG: hypothetical protein WAM60_02300, partial [Candidatus Promineifilaceae bacterium]
MARLRKYLLPFWTAVIILLGLNIVVFNLLIANSAEGLRVQYIPDDGFYYLTLARNFASSGMWSFDSGVSVTSGFHLLFAYILSGIYSAVHPDTNGFVVSGVLVGMVFAVLT